ncbi:hypothetical protein CA54_58020 [Symmachiella macrocystis]|uniref:Uncharacterized protein n=1 Tax=Symmachiella macrocystis TaxID=2527985 RepID=A0A5C6B7X0_9PLAN|nr:DUF6263 family protein [Symmachiella macrocystis]TWU07396.1 hypothetical protein CA54_58020 [Symmachiella macrocystis]
MHRCLVCRSFLILIACAIGTSPLSADKKPEVTAPPVADESSTTATDTAATTAETDPSASSDAGETTASQETAEQADQSHKYELTYIFTPGQVVHLQSNYHAQMTVNFKEAKQIDKNKSKLWKHYTVVAVSEDGSGTLELQLDKAHQEAQFGNHPPEVFKSDDPKFHHRKFRDTLKKIGRPTALIDYSAQGKLLKVVDPAGTNKVAVRKRPPQDHQGFLIPLPSEPVSVGETWKDPYQQSVGIKGGLSRIIDMLRVYELKSVDGDLATIEFKTVILTPVNNKEILVQLIQRQTEGTMVFDMKKGLIVEKLITVNESVVNAFGPGTFMQAVTKLTESTVPENVVAKNEKQAATETK